MCGCDSYQCVVVRFLVYTPCCWMDLTSTERCVGESWMTEILNFDPLRVTYNLFSMAGCHAKLVLMNWRILWNGQRLTHLRIYCPNWVRSFSYNPWILLVGSSGPLDQLWTQKCAVTKFGSISIFKSFLKHRIWTKLHSAMSWKILTIQFTELLILAKILH